MVSGKFPQHFQINDSPKLPIKYSFIKDEASHLLTNRIKINELDFNRDSTIVYAVLGVRTYVLAKDGRKKFDHSVKTKVKIYASIQHNLCEY